ncbi:hypothetical protein [Heliorestis convoluta]|uniref:DUF8042 domain-containing protein n=1 Tax=Heliorestis convoluta TaxID=356322 RepID=A0A5Q2N5H2_9FIRM|nr:hypothetical protein [Heliorestis convoluta]QGG47490.1 hypothetical protein FTV88_1343 [Heliorestis convoluta]
MGEEQVKLREALEWAEFGLGALILCHVKLEQGHYEEAMDIVTDIEERFWDVNDVLEIFADQLPPNQLMLIGETLAESFRFLSTAYGEDDTLQALRYMEISLLPMYQKWEEEVERCVVPLVAN